MASNSSGDSGSALWGRSNAFDVIIVLVIVIYNRAVYSVIILYYRSTIYVHHCSNGSNQLYILAISMPSYHAAPKENLLAWVPPDGLRSLLCRRWVKYIEYHTDTAEASQLHMKNMKWYKPGTGIYICPAGARAVSPECSDPTRKFDMADVQ